MRKLHYPFLVVLLVGLLSGLDSSLGFSLAPKKSDPTTALYQLGSGNYLDSLTQYSQYQHQQRELQERQQDHSNHNYYEIEPQEEYSNNNNNNNNGMMNWAPESSRLPVGESQNMNVESDFGNDYDSYYSVTGQPPVEQVLEEDFERYLKMVSTEVAVKRLNNENTFAITDVPAGVIFNQWLDSMEDALMKLRRYEKGRPYKADRPTIVVLGSGWAAHSFVKLASTYDLKIIVVSPVNHFVSTTVSGWQNIRESSTVVPTSVDDSMHTSRLLVLSH
jgi:hypothetical protein